MCAGFLMVVPDVLVGERLAAPSNSACERFHSVMACLHMLSQIWFLQRNTWTFQFKICKTVKYWIGRRHRQVHLRIYRILLTLEKEWSQPSKVHLILSPEANSSWACRCRLMFFFRCFFPHISHWTCWWQDWLWALRDSTFVNIFMQPGSQHTTSV